jgi:hypothetical protein
MPRWSSGTILASGFPRILCILSIVRGPGFNPRLGPVLLHLLPLSSSFSIKNWRCGIILKFSLDRVEPWTLNLGASDVRGSQASGLGLPTPLQHVTSVHPPLCLIVSPWTELPYWCSHWCCIVRRLYLADARTEHNNVSVLWWWLLLLGLSHSFYTWLHTYLGRISPLHSKMALLYTLFEHIGRVRRPYGIRIWFYTWFIPLVLISYSIKSWICTLNKFIASFYIEPWPRRYLKLTHLIGLYSVLYSTVPFNS